MNLQNKQFEEMLEFSRKIEMISEIICTVKGDQRISSKAFFLVARLWTIVMMNGINEVTLPINSLKNALCYKDAKNLKRDLTSCFKAYGLGDFASTDNFDIFKVKTDDDTTVKIRKETTYVFYFSEKAIKQFEEKGLITKEQCASFIADIESSKNLLKKVDNETDVTVFVRNYITDDYFIDKEKRVKKNHLDGRGTYEEVITENREGKTKEVSRKSGKFNISKEKQ